MGRQNWRLWIAAYLAVFQATSNVFAFHQYACTAPLRRRSRAAATVWLGAGPRGSGLSTGQQVFSTSTTTAAAAGLSPTQRVQRLRDILFQKEALKDITAAEFALRVEIKNEASTIDYERLIFTLENKKTQQEQRGLKTSECRALVERLQRTIDELVRRKSENAGEAGSVAASVTTSQGRGPAAVAAAAVAAAAAAATSKDTAAAKLSQAVADNERLKEIQESLRVIVREDGTVDWDGAKATGVEVARFGTELWERLNGKDESEGLPSVSEMFNPVQAKTPDTDEVLRLKSTVSQAQAALEKVLRARDALRASLRSCRKEGLDVKSTDVQALRGLDTRVSELEKRVRIYVLDLDIERICVYLQNELESSLEPLDQKVFVAEAALLDKQLSSIIAIIPGLAEEEDAAEEGAEDDRQPSSFADLSLVDPDELGLIAGGVNDLKSRLGLDTGPSMDWGSLGVLVTETAAKVRVGLSFYGDGTKLLWSDVQYAGTLLAKAVSGTTLKPREVNTIRRTGKDLLTLIPFTIILIVPLSPVGHVLVFSFIQRFFPDFFPSCYTDKRVNLLKLYTEIEMDESKGLDLGEDPAEPLSLGGFFRFPWGVGGPVATADKGAK